MYCTHCSKLVSEKMAIRRQFCPYCGRRLRWFGIPDVQLSKPILQAIVKRKNFLVQQRLQQIQEFYFKEKETELSLLELQDAIQLNPENIRPRFQLALFYIERKQLEKATETLLQILELSPNHIDTYFQLANIAVEEQQFEAAIDYCDKIIDIDPENLGALYNRAVGYYFSGDGYRALDEFSKLLVKDPENEDIRAAVNELRAKLN